jgi:hypothetical protein
METGFEVHVIAARELRSIEVYPHGAFRELARGTTPPKKTTPAGMRARAALLWAGSVVEPALLMWNHDGLDAAAGGGGGTGRREGDCPAHHLRPGRLGALAARAAPGGHPRTPPD